MIFQKGQVFFANKYNALHPHQVFGDRIRAEPLPRMADDESATPEAPDRNVAVT